MAKIILIAAISSNGVIGNNGVIPWYIPDDFKHFKRTTLNKTIVMGSKTWDSLPSKPLPKRTNIILSRSRKEEDGIWVSSIEDVLKLDDDIYVIGGSQIYEQFLPHAHELIISHIPITVEGTEFFPDINDEWNASSVEGYDEFTVVHYKKHLT